jgi:hypothetical protein
MTTRTAIYQALSDRILNIQTETVKQLAQLETEYKKDCEQLENKVRSKPINNSDLTNLRIVAEAEKLYQEMQYKYPLEKLELEIIHNEKYPIIDSALQQDAITEVLWSNEDNSL